MDYVIAAVFGLSIGTIISFATAPVMRWLPFLSAVFILAIGVGAITWGDYRNPVLGLVIAAAGLVAATLAAGAAWEDHPMLAGSGYWGRVWTAFLHTPTLRRYEAEPADQGLNPVR